MVGCAKEPRRTAAVRTVANTNLISVGWMGEWPVPRFPAGNGIRRYMGMTAKRCWSYSLLVGRDYFEQLDPRSGRKQGGEECIRLPLTEVHASAATHEYLTNTDHHCGGHPASYRSYVDGVASRKSESALCSLTETPGALES